MGTRQWVWAKGSNRRRNGPSLCAMKLQRPGRCGEYFSRGHGCTNSHRERKGETLAGLIPVSTRIPVR
jgi:hypothetical protein